MWDKIRQFFKAPAFEGDEDKTRIARYLNILLWLTLLGAVGVIIPLLPFFGTPLRLAMILGGFAIFIGIAVSLLRSGRVRVASWLYVLLYWLLGIGLTIISGGLSSSLIGLLFVAIIVAGFLLGRTGAVRVAILSVLYVTFIAILQGIGRLPGVLVMQPNSERFVIIVQQYATIAGSLILSTVLFYLALTNLIAVGTRSKQLAVESEKQREQVQTLLAARTDDLTRRTAYLKATTSLARESQLVEGDLERLSSRVVDVITEVFGFYHTALFLLDENKVWLELRAASSSGGQQMLARRHRVAVDSQTMLSHVVQHGDFHVAVDVGPDAVVFDTPELLRTHSQMLAPLRVRNEVLGVLDVQSTQSQAFSEDDIVILLALAEQIAMAINNVQLLQQLALSVEAERRASGDLTRDTWLNLVQSRSDLSFYDDGEQVVQTNDVWRPEMDVALSTGNRVSGQDGATLAVPLYIRDRVVGVLDGRKADGTEWSDDEIELLQALTEQVSTALDGAQLYEDSQWRANRERLVSDATGRIRETLDMETMLQTAANEIRRALDLAEVEVCMGIAPESVTPTDAGIGQGANDG